MLAPAEAQYGGSGTDREATVRGHCFWCNPSSSEHHEDNRCPEFDKKKNVFGQVGTTQARAKVTDTEFHHDMAISNYNTSRAAMIAFGLPEDNTGSPLLFLHGTFWQPTHLKHRVGDSKTSDGHIWLPA